MRTTPERVLVLYVEPFNPLPLLRSGGSCYPQPVLNSQSKTIQDTPKVSQETVSSRVDGCHHYWVSIVYRKLLKWVKEFTRRTLVEDPFVVRDSERQPDENLFRFDSI